MVAFCFLYCIGGVHELLQADFKPVFLLLASFRPEQASFSYSTRLPRCSPDPNLHRIGTAASVARVAIAHLEQEGLIKPVIRHRAQLVYTRTTSEE
ncbi:hypothetical protein RTBOTA2_003867 [Rhodotorula toruloides]|nr:hypothetical protein RTBOTA2_003867 [Rhodotorula toruloides]